MTKLPNRPLRIIHGPSLGGAVKRVQEHMRVLGSPTSTARQRRISEKELLFAQRYGQSRQELFMTPSPLDEAREALARAEKATSGQLYTTLRELKNALRLLIQETQELRDQVEALRKWAR